MEKPKPTQSLEQKQETPEDYVVATFPVDIDPDNARRPLTVIRSGQDGEGVKYDRGWNPIGMSVVCDADSEEGIGPIKLLMEAYKLVGTDIKTEFVPLEDIQGLNEYYIKYLYGKTPKEMIEEAKRIWRQKHPDSRKIESLIPGVGSDSDAESPSNSSVEDNTSNHEKSLADKKVISAMRGLAVKAAGVEKPIDTNKVKNNEPVREPVETDKTGVGSPALKIPEPTMELIRVTEVNGSVGLPAVEPAKKPVEADKTSTDSVNLPAAKSVENPVVEKSMETNETSAGILPESFKSVINNFEKYTEGNNGEFFTKVDKNLRSNLDQLQLQIQRNPEVIKEPATEELMRRASSMIIYLEASRAKAANEFKNNINDILKDLKKKIKNDDELKRLVELTEHVDQMGTDNRVLGDVTNTLLNELTIIINNIEKSRNDRGGIVHYKSTIAQSINKIINSDLRSIYGRRQSILDAIKDIRKTGY